MPQAPSLPHASSPCLKRISLFQKQGAEKTVRVCYRGGVHYDSLVI